MPITNTKYKITKYSITEITPKTTPKTEAPKYEETEYLEGSFSATITWLDSGCIGTQLLPSSLSCKPLAVA
jgi:hypothetical protein